MFCKKVASNFIKEETLAQLFSFEFCEISKNSFFHRTPLVAAFVLQRRSEGEASVAFEVLIINCQMYFINLFNFNCLTLNVKLSIFKLFDVKFLFSENHVFRKLKRTACLWSYGRASLVSQFKLTRENDDLSSRHK